MRCWPGANQAGPVVRPKGSACHSLGRAPASPRDDLRISRVEELPASHGDRTVVPRPTRSRVTREVFEGGDPAGLLETAQVRDANTCDEIGVLTAGLLDPSPPVVPRHV